MGRVSNVIFLSLIPTIAGTVSNADGTASFNTPGNVFIVIAVIAAVIAVSIIFLGVETRGESVEEIGNVD